MESTVEHHENTTIKYDDTEEGKQKKEEILSKINEFQQFFTKLVTPIRVDDIRRNIEEIFPKDIDVWCGKKSINYDHIITLIKESCSLSKNPTMEYYSILCRFRYHVKQFRDRHTEYMDLRKSMINLGSTWAKGLPQLYCVDSIIPITEQVFKKNIVKCSDYDTIKKGSYTFWRTNDRQTHIDNQISHYWNQVTNL